MISNRFLTLLVIAIICFFFISLPAQSPNQSTQKQQIETHSLWDGVYSQKQADRGQKLYYDECSSCHGEKLTGKVNENAPSLTGDRFMKEWNGRTVGDLFRKILRKMPDDDPGTLTPQQSADLVAFLVNFNKFPAGNTELPPESEILNGIRFEATKPQQKKFRFFRLI